MLQTRRFTPEEYETVSERVEIKVEYLNGQIVPKEGLDPLPEWIVEKLLSSDFSSALNYEFPMATDKHHDIISNLFYAFVQVLDKKRFKVYAQGPEVFISLSGRYRIPDVSVAPPKAERKYEQGKMTNPFVVIEVLSPSNRGDDFIEKLEDYKSIPSLQEYWLVSQDKCYIERYVRGEGKSWINLAYNSEDVEIEFPTLGVTLKMEEVYEEVDFEK
jgi:Uma2 family endonuclease